MCLVKTTKIILLKGELVSERMLPSSLSLISTWEEKDTKFNPKKQWQNCFKLFKFLPSRLPTLLTLNKQRGLGSMIISTPQTLSLSLSPPYSFLFCSFFFPPRLSHLCNRPLIREILLNCWQWCTVVLRWHDVWGKRFCCTTTQNQLENYFLRQVRNLHCFS